MKVVASVLCIQAAWRGSQARRRAALLRLAQQPRQQAKFGTRDENQTQQDEKDKRVEARSLANPFVQRFLTTGVCTTVAMVEDVESLRTDEKAADDKDEIFARECAACEDFGRRFGEMITIEPRKHKDEKNHIERYNIFSLKGDWDVLTGDPWKFSKLENGERRYSRYEVDPAEEQKLRKKEYDAVSVSANTTWLQPQRTTVVAMLMYIVVTRGQEDPPNSFHPPPTLGGFAADGWAWAIVTDFQSKHEKGGLERAKLLIAILDGHKFLPKVVLAVLEGYAKSETNLRASPKLLEDFQQEHGGIAHMAMDSIGEMACYSRTEVVLLLLGVGIACTAALMWNTGAGFFLLAVLSANSLEQEINIKLFVFVWKRLFKIWSKKPVAARPGPDVRANYVMVAGFGVVEALFDDDRVPTLVRNCSAIALTIAVVFVALPPLVFIWVMRSRSDYKGPYPLTSPQRQDWVRNSVGCFYGSCSECFFGGAGRGYRCADQQGGRLLNWLAGCSVDQVLWTGTSSGGVHHSVNLDMGRGDWAVVG